MTSDWDVNFTVCNLLPVPKVISLYLALNATSSGKAILNYPYYLDINSLPSPILRLLKLTQSDTTCFCHVPGETNHTNKLVKRTEWLGTMDG